MASLDRHYMRMALSLAQHAGSLGEVPVGAVLVVEGKIVAVGENSRMRRGSVLGHAELMALESANAMLGDWRVLRSTLYVTLEPCIMCAGALIQSRIDRIVFGCRDPKAGAVRSLYALLEDPRLNHRVKVDEGVFAEDCRNLLQSFFEKLR